MSRVIPIYSALPFIVMLAGIAVLPLAAPAMWERNRSKALFAALLAFPVGIWLFVLDPAVLAPMPFG